MPTPVTDPNLIAELDRLSAQQGLSGQPSGKTVTDPVLIARLQAVEKEQNRPNMAMRFLQSVGDTATSAYEGVKGAVQGQQDPAFSDIGGFTGEGLPLSERSSLARSEFTSAGFDDAAYGDIVKKTLGNRLKNVQTDKFGQEIITYQGDDGKDYTTYVNKPGLDWQDVNRTISGSLPYVATSMGAGRLLKGYPLLARALGQGVAAGTTSLAQDQAARQIGSEQPVDIGKAGVTSLFGAGGEFATAALSPILKKLFGKKYYDPKTGSLTKAGIREAEKNGIDPIELQNVMQERQARGMRPDPDDVLGAKNPEEAMIASKTDTEFGIPTTKGQRTKDPQQLQTEEEMRRSLFGPGAKEIISDFDTLQRARIQEATKGVQGKVAPSGGVTPQEAGQGISEAFQTAEKASKAQEGALWNALPDIYPEEGATQRLAPILQRQFADLGFVPDEQLTPAAHAQMQLLEDYVSGSQIQTPYKLLGDQGARPTIDEMRRRLLGIYNAAKDKTDKKASRAIYDSFNEWIDELGSKGLLKPAGLEGSTPEEVVKGLVKARKFTREQRSLFGADVKNNPAGRILQKLVDEGDTPERIVQSLFGSSPNSVPKAGTVEALRRLKLIFNKNDKSAWDQVKAAYWLNLTRGKTGEVLRPGYLRSAIDKAFEKQKSTIDVLFTPSEQDMMKRFRDAVDSATFAPPNPSGTSYALESQRQRRRDNVLRYLLRRMGTRETFRGNTLKGSIFHALSKKLPNVFDAGETIRRNLASEAVSQAIPRKKASSPLANAFSGPAAQLYQENAK